MKWKDKAELDRRAVLLLAQLREENGGVLRGSFGPFCHPERVELTRDVLLKQLRVVGHRLDYGRCLGEHNPMDGFV